jgi:glycine hydroxymethyltransferase
MVPFDDKSPFITSGIRIGTAAITTRGMKEHDCIKIVEWIDALITKPEDEALAATIKNEVRAFASKFPLYAW